MVSVMKKRNRIVVFASLLLLVSSVLGEGIAYIKDAKIVSAGAQNIYSVIIDPGHGGEDGGAQNKQLGLVESELTLRIADKLERYLTFA